MRIEKLAIIKRIDLDARRFLGNRYQKGDTVVTNVKCSAGSQEIDVDLPAPPDFVNLLAIVSLDKDELKQLGLKSGWASIFGERQ